MVILVTFSVIYELISTASGPDTHLEHPLDISLQYNIVPHNLKKNHCLLKKIIWNKDHNIFDDHLSDI